MAQFGPSIQTATITTGNVRTTIDPYTGSSFAAYPEPFGAKNPLGSAYYDNQGSTTNPYGTGTKYRYVRYNSTSNPALTSVTGPFVVYWTDATFTTVTPVSSEALTATVNLPAGLAMPNLTSLPSLTAAQLNGNYIWIAVGGYVPGAYFANYAAAIGTGFIGTATNFTPAVVSAVTQRVIGFTTTAAATNLANVFLTLES